MSKLDACPVCGLQEDFEIARDSAPRDAFHCSCRRCGRYWITGQMATTPPFSSNADLLPYLSAYTRQSSESGVDPELTIYNWEDFARSHGNTPTPQKATKLLRLFASQSKHPGEWIPDAPAYDYPLIDAASEREYQFFKSYLLDRGHIELAPKGITFPNSYRLTVDGWNKLEPIATQEAFPPRCFVAMWFDKSVNEARDLGIKQAIVDTGFEPILVNEVHFNDDVCDKILAEIRLAHFIIADFTGNRGGVYFEAGYGMALGKPVILACREDVMKYVHFDTNHYNHITWTTPEDLRAKLTDRIRATILK